MCKHRCSFSSSGTARIFIIAGILLPGSCFVHGQVPWDSMSLGWGRASEDLDTSRTYSPNFDPFRTTGRSVREPSVSRETALPERTPEEMGARPSTTGEATVSADYLKHPISAKVHRMLVKAQNTANAGDHETAIKMLRNTMDRHPSSAPYARSLLGVEYAKMRRFELAVDVLEAAARDLPHYAGNYSNLAYALCVLGQFDRAGTAVRRALELDRNSTTANMIQQFLEQRKEALTAATAGRLLQEPAD